MIPTLGDAMKGTILVPLDGSETAERAVPLALAVAARADATLRLIHVHVPPDDSYASLDSYRFEFDTMDQAEAYLGTMMDRLRASAAPVVTADVVRGDVAETLSHEIRKEDVGLVALCSHGTGGPRAALTGSVAARILRDASVPLVVHGPSAHVPHAMGDGPILDMEIGNVLVALDDTAASAAVLEHATNLARLFGARVTLVAVAADNGRVSTSGSQKEPHFRTLLDRTAEQLSHDGVPANTRLVHASDAAAAILRCSAEEDADVIAIPLLIKPNATRPATQRTVAAAVLASSRLPVLTLPSVQRD